MPDDVTYIRASSLSGWNDCPRRGMARQYPDIFESATGVEVRREEKRFVSAAIGTSIHRGAQTILTMKMQGESASIDDMIGASMASYAEETADGIEYDGTTAAPSVAEQQIIILAREYYNSVFPEIEPIAIEQSLSAFIGSEGAFKLTGHPDVIERRRIRDIKTGRHGHNCHAQLGAYTLLAAANDIGEPPDELVVDHLPRKTPNKPYPGIGIFRYDADACTAEARAVLKIIMIQIRDLRNEKTPDVVPANPSSILCSEKFCPAYGTDFCRLFTARAA
jgi:hypothetical protein